MRKVMLSVLIISVLLISSAGLLYDNNQEEVKCNMDEVYQGPVPLGYDLEYYRRTGETIKEVEA